MPLELYDTYGNIVNYSGKVHKVTDDMIEYFKNFVDENIRCPDIQMSIDNSSLPAINFFLERKLPETSKHKAMDVVCGVSYLINQVDGKVCGYNCFKYEPPKNGRYTARELMDFKYPCPKDIINSSMKGYHLSMWSEYESIFPEIKKIIESSAKQLKISDGAKDGYSPIKNNYSICMNVSYIGDEQREIYENFKSLRNMMQILGVLEKMRYDENHIKFTLDNGVEDYVVSFGSVLEYNGIYFDDPSHFIKKYFSTEGIDKKGLAFERWYGDDKSFKDRFYHPFFERTWDFSREAQDIVELFEDEFDNSDLEYER